MINIKKTNNSNTKSKEPAKKMVVQPFSEVHQDARTFVKKPINRIYILEFAKDWVEWALDDEQEGLKLEQYYMKRSVYKSAVQEWEKRIPELKEAREFARMVVGVRREIGALRKIYDPSIVKFTMPIYDDEWKEIYEWQVAIKAKIEKESHQPSTFNIYTQDYTKI